MNIQNLGIQDYTPIWLKMKEFTMNRTPASDDELWLLEHHPVYTQGQAGKPEHILNTNAIPIIQSDRGGQVTYHGPGQLVVYVLIDIIRLNMGVRTLVSKLERVLIATLARYHIEGQIRCGAPGVYVKGQKIASIGLRVKNGRTYHGIALNVNMDLKPFSDINPCGFATMEMTQIHQFQPSATIDEVSEDFLFEFKTQFESV
jgi:lipoyl(octanoyl) transferase